MQAVVACRRADLPLHAVARQPGAPHRRSAGPLRCASWHRSRPEGAAWPVARADRLEIADQYDLANRAEFANGFGNPIAAENQSAMTSQRMRSPPDDLAARFSPSAASVAVVARLLA